MNKPALFRKYTVLQAEEAFDLYTTAALTGSSIELDLAGTDDLRHIVFQPTTMLHDEHELRLIGTTAEHQTINIIFNHDPNGTLHAKLALITGPEH